MSRAGLSAVVLGGLASAGALTALGCLLLGAPSWGAVVSLYLAPFPGLAAVLLGAVAMSDGSASAAAVRWARTGLGLGVLPIAVFLAALLLFDPASG